MRGWAGPLSPSTGKWATLPAKALNSCGERASPRTAHWPELGTGKEMDSQRTPRAWRGVCWGPTYSVWAQGPGVRALAPLDTMHPQPHTAPWNSSGGVPGASLQWLSVRTPFLLSLWTLVALSSILGKHRRRVGSTPVRGASLSSVCVGSGSGSGLLVPCGDLGSVLPSGTARGPPRPLGHPAWGPSPAPAQSRRGLSQRG